MGRCKGLVLLESLLRYSSQRWASSLCFFLSSLRAHMPSLGTDAFTDDCDNFCFVHFTAQEAVFQTAMTYYPKKERGISRYK